MLVIKDCVSKYAKKRGITVSQAETEFKTALDVICEACEKDKGVSFRGLFTIKKVMQKERKGVINGKEWKSPAKNKLVFSIGNILERRINEVK